MTHPDPLSWVCLDSWDVNPAELEGAGQPWEAVIPVDVDNRIDDSIQPLPRHGWREVAIRVEDPSLVQGRLFAAPDSEGWSVAYLSPPVEGKPVLSVAGAVRLRPGRPSRRHGLRLTFPTGVEIPASGLQDLQITLANDGDVAWVADPQDAQYVHAWLLDGNGVRLGSSMVAYAVFHQVPEVGPGQEVLLPVAFGPDSDLTPSGIYGVEAVMPALDLWSARSTIGVLP